MLPNLLSEHSQAGMVREEVFVLLQDGQHRLGPGDGGHHFQPLWLELDRPDVAHCRVQMGGMVEKDPQQEQEDLKLNS